MSCSRRFSSALKVSILFFSVAVFAPTAHGAPSIGGLNWRVLDAEYSLSLDKIIMVSSSPDQLHIYDPVTTIDVTVDLPLAPSSVSVGPDGLFAAVGHDGWISYVDLAAGTWVKTMAVTTDVLDVVLAGNGFVYAFPRRDQWERIRCIEIASEEETVHSGYSIYAGTVAKLHPNGTAIYGADNHLSPSDIEKYSIAGGTAQYLYDSPYHGDFAMCGNLWISEDGLRIFTACGNVFRASDIQSEDMTHNGSLSDAPRVRSVAHSSAANEVLVIASHTSTADTEVQVYGYDFLAFEDTLPLPAFELPTGSFDAHGRFVFYNSDGSQIYVIVQADEASGLLLDYGMVVFGAQPPVPPCNIELDQQVYASGDFVTATVFRLANSNSNPWPIEWKVWLETPSGDYPVVNAGADQSLVLPSGFDMDFGPIPLFRVTPSSPPGAYGLHCRILEPITGATVFLDENPFVIQ